MQANKEWGNKSECTRQGSRERIEKKKKKMYGKRITF